MIATTPKYKLELSVSPHVHSHLSVKQAMWLVVIALLPTLISSVIFFGPYQLVIILVSVFFAVGTEVVVKKIRHMTITIDDGSAVITGLLLGLVLPPNFSLIYTAVGAIFAIGIVKELFGGLGYNIFNPALAARAFLQAAFPVAMTTWSIPKFNVDSVTSATPLAAYKFEHILSGLQPMIIGNISGSIGETSAIAIIIGGLFLIAAGVINWRIPVSMILGMAIIASVFWVIDPMKFANPIFHIFAGGFLLGAFFMATDWVTSPITIKGMWIYGFGISFLVILIRVFGGLPEGVMYGILLMNALVPIINRYTSSHIFGEKP